MASEVTSIDDADTRPVNQRDSSDIPILTVPENGDHSNDSNGQLGEVGSSQSEPFLPAPGDENLPLPESGTAPERGPNHQNRGIEQYKAMQKRLHELALEMIAAQFEQVTEDTNESDDARIRPTDARSNAESDKSGTSDSENEELHTPTGMENAPDVSYKAQFYEYVRYDWRIEREPELRRTIVKKRPIAITPANPTRIENQSHSFDVTSMYAIPQDADTAHTRTLLSAGILAELGTYITIRSRVLIESLENIAPYYPMVSFVKDELVLHEPFCILLHYHEELAERRGVLERAVHENEYYNSVELEHLTYVLNFVQQRYADALLQEEMRHQESQAMCTFEWSWLLFRPGTVVYSWQDGLLRAFVVEKHDKALKRKMNPKSILRLDELERKPLPLQIIVWFLDFDGDHIGRRRQEYLITPFDGAKPIQSLPIFPKEYMNKNERLDASLSTEEYLIKRGQLFCEMTTRSYMHCDGETVKFPKKTVSLEANEQRRCMMPTSDFTRSAEES